MKIRSLTLAITVALMTLGLGCATQPPAMNGGDGQNGGNDNNDGNGQNGGEIDGLVGSLNASISRTISTSGALESVTAGAFFSRVEDQPDGSNVDQKIIGDCVVITATIGDPATEIPDVEPLDAGPSGTVSHGGRATAMFSRQSEGVYVGPIDLASQGFAAGQTIVFEFPGGDDVAAFMASIELPGELTVTSPNLADSNLTIDNSAALPFAWSANGTADGVRVVISTTNVGSTVTITCTFDDTGSATVPQAAMECLLDNALTTTVSVALVNTARPEVDLVAGGTGSVQTTAQTSISRGLVADLDTGGGDFDVCQFINCPEGQTCNPETFLCE